MKCHLIPLIVSLTIVLAGCASVTPAKPPLLSPFGDGTQWIVWEDIDFIVEFDDKSTGTIRVPRGFVTDLASTPPEVWKWYPPFGKYLTASILHDYLYWRQACTQEQADKIFAQAMRDADVPAADQSRFYVALQAFGKKALLNNQAEKNEGLIRVLPLEYLNTSSRGRTPQATWKDLRKALRDAKVTEPVQQTDASIPIACTALGREIKVNTDLWTLLFRK